MCESPNDGQDSGQDETPTVMGEQNPAAIKLTEALTRLTQLTTFNAGRYAGQLREAMHWVDDIVNQESPGKVVAADTERRWCQVLVEEQILANVVEEVISFLRHNPGRLTNYFCVVSRKITSYGQTPAYANLTRCMEGFAQALEQYKEPSAKP